MCFSRCLHFTHLVHAVLLTFPLLVHTLLCLFTGMPFMVGLGSVRHSPLLTVACTALAVPVPMLVGRFVPIPVLLLPWPRPGLSRIGIVRVWFIAWLLRLGPVPWPPRTWSGFLVSYALASSMVPYASLFLGSCPGLLYGAVRLGLGSMSWAL